MTVLNPQPASPGIKYTSQEFSGDGSPINDGPYVEFIYSALGSATSYQSVLTAWGLLSSTSNDVTVYVRNEHFAYVRMNGKAIKPLPGNGVEWQRPFPRSITILVRDLEAAA